MPDLYLALLFAVAGFFSPADPVTIPPTVAPAFTRAIVHTDVEATWRFFRTAPPISLEPYRRPGRVTARMGVVRDVKSGEILWSRHADRVSSIASLTKLMTAAVVVDSRVGLDDEVEITVADIQLTEGNTLEVRPGERITRRDLLRATLVGSMNNAALTLARSTGTSDAEFVALMNTTAGQYGMTDTTFTEPTGLDPANMSTAHDLARLIERLFEHETIREIVLEEAAELTILPSRRVIRVRSTNELLIQGDIAFRGAKTGYLDEAGYTYAALVEQGEHQLSVILLGSSTGSARFTDARTLAEWAFSSFVWPDRWRAANTAASTISTE